jgi:CIC family chloride channel protein
MRVLDARLLRWLGREVGGPRPGARLVVAVVVGAAAGLISTGFWDAIAALEAILEFYVALPLDRALSLPAGWLHVRVLFPALGALAAALLARWVFVTPQRLGVASVMLDARREWGRIPLRYVPATFVNGVLTIGSGGSAGREAPVVAMGGGLGAWVARSLEMPPAQRRLLVGCGAAAAIAAAFNAPLAGVFFTLEVVLGDFRLTTLAPVMLASVAGTVVCRATEGSEKAAHFAVPAYHLVSGWEVGLYVGLGVVAGLVGVAFMALLRRSEERFSRSRIPVLLRPAVGGLGVGLLGLLHPGILGNGYPSVIAACDADLAFRALLVLLVGKLVATALTLGSGGWGGDFAPTLFVGSMTGALYGAGLKPLLGDQIAGYGAYAMVGMGAVLAAVIRCPITAILLLFELTGSYEVIVPIMVAVATATFVAGHLSRLGLYHARLHDLGGPTFEMAPESHLGGHSVAAVMGPLEHSLPEHAGLDEIKRLIATSRQTVFPVVDARGVLAGVVRLADLRAGIAEATGDAPIIAADVALDDVPLVTPDTPLPEAAALLAAAEWEELPVVRSAADRRPCGIISRQQVLRASVVGVAFPDRE